MKREEDEINPTIRKISKINLVIKKSLLVNPAIRKHQIFKPCDRELSGQSYNQEALSSSTLSSRKI
jgi:hypothetical protein